LNIGDELHLRRLIENLILGGSVFYLNKEFNENLMPGLSLDFYLLIEICLGGSSMSGK